MNNKTNQINYEIVPLTAIIFGYIGMFLFGGTTLVVLFLNFKTLFKFNKNSFILLIFIIIFILFFLLSLFLTLYCQQIVISNEGISIKRMKKSYSMKYSEIEYCYECSGNMNIGNDIKQISFPSFDYWNGKNKRDAFILMLTLLQERNVKRKISIKGLFPHIRGFVTP